jgi:tryptophan synthase alpha chain
MDQSIQESSTMALHNGMTSPLFDQLVPFAKVKTCIIIMGYFNPMLQYGIEAFCKKCANRELMV